MTRALTIWIWLSLILLWFLAAFVLYQWLFVVRELGYPVDFYPPLADARDRAQFGRIGIEILLPLALATYLVKVSQMSRPVRRLYFSAIGFAGTVLVLYWSTRFRNW
jgi:hypothetical protein